MKKILFLLLGLTIAVGASAGAESWRNHRPVKKQAVWPKLNQQAKPNANFHKSGQPAKLRGYAPQAIYDQPEGTQVNYSRSGSYYLLFTSGVDEQSGYISVVYAPDGSTVYLKGLNVGISPNCWVQGTIANGRITIPLGQYTLTYFEDGEYYYGLVLTWGTMESAGPGYDPVFTPNPDVTEVTFLIDGDNLVMENSQPGDANGLGAEGLACVWDDDGFCAAMEWETVFTPSDVVIPHVIDYLPQGDLVLYDRSYADIIAWMEDIDYFYSKSSIIYAPDGETVYIMDPVAFNNSGTWVQGTISGNKIHVPLDQYVYFDYTTAMGLKLAWGTASALPEDSEYFFAFTPDENVTEYTYTIDGDNIFLDNGSIGSNGDGATGVALIPNDEDNPEFIMECTSEFTPYVEPTVIYDQPDGELVTYTRRGFAIDHYGDDAEQEGEVNIVFAPDGETVYIQDIIYPIYEGSWVMGTIEGNKVHVPLKQYLYWEDYYEYGLTLAMGQLSYNNSYWMDCDLSITEATFTISGSDFILDNTSFGPYDDYDGATVLAAVYTDDMSWMESSNLMTVFHRTPTVIEEDPDGDIVSYIRSGYYLDEYGWPQTQVGTVDIVYADDGETVYIRNLAYTCYEQKSVWVKGTIANGKIHVPVGQYLWYDEESNDARVLAWGSFIPGKYFEFNPDPDVTEITLTINGDSISLDNSYYSGHNDEAAIGLTSMNPYTQEAWTIEYGTIFVPYFEPEVIYNEPEGDMVTYKRTGYAICNFSQLNKKNKGNRYIDPVNLIPQMGEAFVVYAPDGETVYLQDPVFCDFDYNRGSWVRGTLNADGTKITVPLGQFVTWFDDYCYGDRLAWGSTSVEAPNPENPDAEQKVIFTPDNSVTAVTYTIENGCLIMDNTQGCTYEEFCALVDQYNNYEIDEDEFEAALTPMLSTTGLAHINLAGGWTGEINWGTKYANLHPTTLPDPVILSWNEAQDKWSDTYLEVQMPEFDTDGLPIFEEALSYSIYTDNDQLFTFEADKYNINEDMTEVAYDTWMNYDWSLNITSPCFNGTWSDTDGFVPFFNWRIGIQFHYTVDGVRNSTGITYIEVYEKPEDPVKPGDANGDGIVNISDVILLINYLSNGDSVTIVDDNSDLNGDKDINITDVILLINQLSNQ